MLLLSGDLRMNKPGLKWGGLLRFPGEKRHDKWLILAIMLFCFFIRRGVFPQFVNKYKVFYASAHWQKDVDGWLKIARNLTSGKGYRYNNKELTARRGPVFPIYLAFMFKAFGHKRGLPIALTMQMVFDTLSCWLIWMLAWKLFRCRYTALLAALMWAVYLPAMVLDLLFHSEPLFILLLCLFNLNMLYLIERLTWPRFLLGGVLLGLATLCRPITLYFPLFLLPMLIWFFRRQPKKIWRGAMVFLFGFSLILSPWVIRNYLQFKKFVPASTLLGLNWYYSLIRLENPNYLNLDEFYDWEEMDRITQQRLSSQGIDLKEKNEAERDQILRGEAWKLIKKHPYRYLVICLNRLSQIWLDSDIKNHSRLLDFAIFLINAPIIILFLSTFIFFREGLSFSFFPMVLLILYNSIGYMLVLGSWRFNIPMMPYVLIFSAYALVRICMTAHNGVS